MELPIASRSAENKNQAQKREKEKRWMEGGAVLSALRDGAPGFLNCRINESKSASVYWEVSNLAVLPAAEAEVVWLSFFGATNL